MMKGLRTLLYHVHHVKQAQMLSGVCTSIKQQVQLYKMLYSWYRVIEFRSLLGMYLCASCHTTGQWSSIQEIMTKRKPHVNAATEQSELKVMKQILEQIRENTNPIHVLDEQSRKHVLSYLMENSFSVSKVW